MSETTFVLDQPTGNRSITKPYGIQYGGLSSHDETVFAADKLPAEWGLFDQASGSANRGIFENKYDVYNIDV